MPGRSRWGRRACSPPAPTAALLTSRWQVDPWLALAAAPVVAGVFGVLIALPSLRVKGPTWRW